MASGDSRLLDIGRITKPHGLRGEVLVSLTTTETSRLDPGSNLHAGSRVLTVASSQLHLQRFIVAFEGVQTREAAEQLRGTVLQVEPKATSDDGEADVLWVHEVIGARVFDADGRDRGLVINMYGNPASDLIELESGDLIPLRFVVGGVESGPDGSFLRVAPPEGLLSD
ncbi:MAG: ribosome maturation factor RimM [Actinomycetes bacterium]